MSYGGVLLNDKDIELGHVEFPSLYCIYGQFGADVLQDADGGNESNYSPSEKRPRLETDNQEVSAQPSPAVATTTQGTEKADSAPTASPLSEQRVSGNTTETQRQSSSGGEIVSKIEEGGLGVSLTGEEEKADPVPGCSKKGK